jgi:ssDNA-binding Zn-finger/Zn-ribbon topoisomerase 1
MKNEINCNYCKNDIVIIENKLFYPDEELETVISCPICNSKLLSQRTDGWFFVQSKVEYEKGLKIEKDKKRLTFPV